MMRGRQDDDERWLVLARPLDPDRAEEALGLPTLLEGRKNLWG
jgi:hypothetical protein